MHCKPTLIKNCLPDTKRERNDLSFWSPMNLAKIMGSEKFSARMSSYQNKRLSTSTDLKCSECETIWESDCSVICASIEDIINWSKEEVNVEKWYYMDYKHMMEHFHNFPELTKYIDWSIFGLDGRSWKESTFWLGTAGAHTPCHLDTYGCNLVLQLHGRKVWVLFPPEDGDSLYQTRIPYEESSVYSNVNILHPNLLKHPKFKESHPHCVTLSAGEALFVPKHWWHFVYCLDTSVTVNTWIELKSDDKDRYSESLVKFMLHKMLGEKDHWLNPNEKLEDDETLLHYIDVSLERLKQEESDDSKTSSFPRRLGCEECMITPPDQAQVEELEETPFEDYLATMSHLHPQVPSSSCDTSQTLTTDTVLNSFLHPDVIRLVCEKMKSHQ